LPENLLNLLKLCLLALLYLFFLRVLWAVWAEVRMPKVVATAPAPAAGREKPRKVRAKDRVGHLSVVDPKDRAGTLFDIGPEITIGRATGCAVSVPDDTYVSQLHARVFQRDGLTYVEDLGSTNGTYVNGMRVTTAVPVRRGDRVQVGSTILEAR
jgi:FHA domain